jgi:adenine-specific DNA-methyltransferase
VFIDPPYNTGSAFTHYDDGLEHSIWLGLMRDRLEIIRRLMSEDGSLWITIDDNEAHYLKVLCDEVFGRANFVANCLWEKVYSERMDARGFSTSHDHLLVYQRSERFKARQLAKEQNELQFSFVDEANGKFYRRRSRGARIGRPCGTRSPHRMEARFGPLSPIALKVGGGGRRNASRPKQVF